MNLIYVKSRNTGQSGEFATFWSVPEFDHFFQEFEKMNLILRQIA
jgi:hypothetical protein